MEKIIYQHYFILMTTFARKTHMISTFLAVCSIFFSMILVFLALFDRVLSLDLFPQAFERILFLAAWVVGIVAIGSTLISLVLSHYQKGE